MLHNLLNYSKKGGQSFSVPVKQGAERGEMADGDQNTQRIGERKISLAFPSKMSANRRLQKVII